MKKEKNLCVTLFAIIGFAFAVAAIVVAILKFCRREYHPCDCDFDFDEDSEDDDGPCCDENGCAYTDDSDFEK